MQYTEAQEPQENDRDTCHQVYEGRSMHVWDSQLQLSRRGGLTPIRSPPYLLVPGVKHGGNDEKPGDDDALAYAHDEPASEESAEGVAGCLTAQRDGPDEYVDAVLNERRRCEMLEPGPEQMHSCNTSITQNTKQRRMLLNPTCRYVPHPFTDGEVLQCQILRVLKDEVGQVEYGS